jgi:hypothetical protein
MVEPYIANEIILGSEIKAAPKLDFRPVERLMMMLYGSTTVLAAAMIPTNIALTLMKAPHLLYYLGGEVMGGIAALGFLETIRNTLHKRSVRKYGNAFSQWYFDINQHFNYDRFKKAEPYLKNVTPCAPGNPTP